MDLILIPITTTKVTENMVKKINSKLFIVHHWVTTSTVKTALAVVIVVGSIFKSIDTETKSVVLNLFQHNQTS